MITFLWKGVTATATLIEGVWTGPPDCDLTQFADEAAAAERLAGEVVTAPEPDPEPEPTP